MKTIILIILFSVSVFSQDYKVERKLLEFAKSIIENPEKIENIQNYYPEFYIENYFDNFMKEPMYRQEIINNIKSRFKKIDDKEEIDFYPINREQLLPNIATSIVMDSTISEFTQLIIQRNYDGIRFIFVRKDIEYYLCKIEYASTLEILIKDLPPIFKPLVEKIIETPEKLKNIKENFPDFYNDDYLDNEDMKDSSYINNLIKKVNLDYKTIDDEERIRVDEPNQKELDRMININAKNVKLSDFIDFTIWRKNIGINFIFIKNDNKYYICRIGKKIDIRYKEY